MYLHPTRLVDAPEGDRLEQAAGCRISSFCALFGANPAKPSPFEGPAPALLTRTDLFGSGWKRPVHFWRGQERFALVFCLDWFF
jgi:hypothetical protein